MPHTNEAPEATDGVSERIILSFKALQGASGAAKSVKRIVFVGGGNVQRCQAMAGSNGPLFSFTYIFNFVLYEKVDILTQTVIT